MSATGPRVTVHGTVVRAAGPDGAPWGWLDLADDRSHVEPGHDESAVRALLLARSRPRPAGFGEPDDDDWDGTERRSRTRPGVPPMRREPQTEPAPDPVGPG